MSHYALRANAARAVRKLAAGGKPWKGFSPDVICTRYLGWIAVLLEDNKALRHRASLARSRRVRRRDSDLRTQLERCRAKLDRAITLLSAAGIDTQALSPKDRTPPKTMDFVPDPTPLEDSP